MANTVPLLKQWDDAWGDYPYGNSTLAAAGSAPTCFTMIAQFYGINIKLPEVANFAIINSYYPTDCRTGWKFFSAAGQYYGIPMHLTSDPAEVRNALKNGKPCIGAHGPGEFTNKAHFIVYAYITNNDEVLVNDPNREETCKLYPWDFLVMDNANTGYIAFVPD